MSWADERAFIERQLKFFHTFLDEMFVFRNSVDRVSKQLKFISHNTVTVAYCTNFRDVFWHLAKALDNDSKGIDTYPQYLMMLEHLNRAVVDLLVDTLQKLQHIHRLIANSYKEGLKAVNKSRKYVRPEQRLVIAKNGYLCARKAILMLRNKRSGLYSLIAGEKEFNSFADYHDNTIYYKEVISLLCQSYGFLLALKCL